MDFQKYAKRPVKKAKPKVPPEPTKPTRKIKLRVSYTKVYNFRSLPDEMCLVYLGRKIDLGRALSAYKRKFHQWPLEIHYLVKRSWWMPIPEKGSEEDE